MALKLPSVRDLNKINVGIISVAVIAAAVAGAFAIGTLGLFENRYELSAVFTDSGGVKTGAEVRVAGVQVGEVTGINPDFETGQVVVTFEVDTGIHLGPNTRVDVIPATLLGGFYLRLSGPIEEPYLDDQPVEDRRIPLARTTGPQSIIVGLGDLTRQVQELNIDNINRALTEVADSTTRNQDQFPVLIEDLLALSTAINEREEELQGLIDNAQQVSATLASRDEELVQLIDTAGVLLDLLSTRRDDLAAILGEGSEAVTQLTDLIASHRAEFENIFSDLHTVLGAVDRQLPTINTVLAYAGPTFSLLGNAVSEDVEVGFTIRGDGVGVLSADLLGAIFCGTLGVCP